MKARMKPPFRIPYWNTRQRSHLQQVPRNKRTATLSKNDAVAITVTAGSTQGQELAFLPEHLIANGYEGGTGNHAESLACDKSISFKSSLNWLNRATKKISLKTIMRKQSLLCKKCLPCTGRFASCLIYLISFDKHENKNKNKGWGTAAIPNFQKKQWFWQPSSNLRGQEWMELGLKPISLWL